MNPGNFYVLMMDAYFETATTYTYSAPQLARARDITALGDRRLGGGYVDHHKGCLEVAIS